ncbi:LysR substrate-binding domain-containing protein [Sphingomonas sp. BIUV-7]|uniref:LysR substrate-binding domain-containing protein n=1 Tax=Sphingomonas natans TaxID=3063330 RepID=A0ABT8YA08_9SPHN|nr:LysR substrate-binding domain-containing protein [Sphingomonas sp. BIUV-7]MDO6415174.1 LysR substrate-binding domain-containing protein [Sphingomonas sp. BIUV-7]
MTFDHLRIFVAVAEHEHVTRAAAILNLTQSAASGAIAALEARHGVPLFHRVGRGIRLTEAGRMFLDEARAVLARAAQAEEALADYAGLQRGALKLVASQTIASYWLPSRLASFHARFPQIAVDLAIDNTEGAARRVLDGGADLGFVEGVIDEPALAHWTVARDRLALVGTAPATDIDDEWLRAARWIVREQGSGTRSSFETVLRDRGIDPAALTIGMTLPSNEAVRTAVEAGAGVAVLSALVVARAVAAGDLHELPLPLPERPFLALRHKERHRSPAADALADLIKDDAK